MAVLLRHGTVVRLRFGKARSAAGDAALRLLDMAEVFADDARLDLPDNRRDYGEARRVTVCQALDGVFTVVYTMRGPMTWLVTAWPANRKERARYGAR